MTQRKAATDPQLDPGEVAPHARNVRFDWSGTPLRWMPNEPIAAHTINALNLLLPEGERMFCATFTEALALVRDDRLREQMLGFIGQESMHAETHDKVLWEVLDAHGIDPRPFLRHSEYVFRKTLGPKKARSPRAARQQLVERLTFIAALEHFFAYLGNWMLNADMERFDADPEVLDLFRWHGAEEVEHRFVAHDVAAYFGATYLRRVSMTILAFVAFLLLVFRGAKYLVRQDPELPDLGYLRLTWRAFGAMWRGALPGVPSLLRSSLSILDPRYTPESVGNTAQAVAYLAQSPAARAAAS